MMGIKYIFIRSWDNEFKYIATNLSNGIEVWARFTGYNDCIQYIYKKDGEQIGDIMTTDFSRLVLEGTMLEKLRDDFIKQEIKMSAKWNNYDTHLIWALEEFRNKKHDLEEIKYEKSSIY